MESKEIEIKLPLENPTPLKTMSRAELTFLCARLRKEIIRVCSLYGGHLSSNLGDIELTVALHKNFDFAKDKLLFDVGHQCYAHKLLTGRSLEHLNEQGQVAGFQKIAESIYDPWEAGHSSTSISAAEAFAIARDEKGEKYDVVAFIGDASIVNGLALEALNNLGSTHHKVIIVLNDNDMSISPPVGAIGNWLRKLSSGRSYLRMKHGYRRVMAKTKFGRKIYSWTSSVKEWLKRKLVAPNLFDNLGFDYVGTVDGHDLKALDKAIARAKRCDNSVVLHVRTVKGKGYSYAEKDLTGYWHGVTPFDIATGMPKQFHPGYISWSHFFADLTDGILRDKPNSHVIVPATRKGSGLEKAFADFPTRCHDVGIAEEHAATLCGALAVSGIHPILSIYSTFMQRCYDEIAHDCARVKADMTILVDRAGLVGKNGDTHQGIYDVAYLKSIPNVVITMPSTKAIARALYYQSFDNHGVFAIRYPREMVHEGEDFMYAELPYMRWRYERNSTSKKLAIVAVGPKERELLDLAKARYLDAEIVDPVYLYPLQQDNVLPLLKFQNILIYDAYGIKEGFADTLLAALSEYGYQGNVVCRAVPNQFVAHATGKEQLAQFGLLPEQILEIAQAMLAKARNAK